MTMQERFVCAINVAWEAIAYDVLAGRDLVSRKEAVENVLDAAALETYGDDREAVAELRKLPFKEQKRIARLAMPDRHYGR